MTECHLNVNSLFISSPGIKLLCCLISFSLNRFPAKSWDLVGQFMARDLKGLQNFHVSGEKLIKYVKVSIVSEIFLAI